MELDSCRLPGFAWQRDPDRMQIRILIFAESGEIDHASDVSTVNSCTTLVAAKYNKPVDIDIRV